MIKGPYSPSPLFYQPRASDSPLKHQHTSYYTPSTIESYQHPMNSAYAIGNNSVASAPRTLPPHIALQKPSEPGSPATVATTMSCHSTPSPSPSRVVIMPEQGPVSNDFTLFDEALLAASQELSQKAREGSNLSVNHSDSNHYSTSNFPMIVQQDAGYNSNSNSFNLYNNYGGLAIDSGSSLYDSSNSQRAMQTSYNDFHGSRLGLPLGQPNHNHIDEEDVPALSPNTSHFSQSSRPSISSSVGTYRSNATPDRGQEGDDKVNYNTMHIHTPVPKLGRTYSDAVQDELYSPGLIQPTEYAQKSRKTSHKKSASSSSLKNVMANFPDLFQEAQQQHQQTLSPQRQQHTQPRDTSPFRANSPFHPVNSRFTFNANQQMKQATADAPTQISSAKTISPRDAMLEYTEPEGEGVRINLFGPTRENSQEESLAMQQSSQGSSTDDYQSIATSRRPSVTSAGSHVDIPLQYNYAQPMYPSTYYNIVPDTGVNHIPAYDDNRSSYSEESSYEHVEKPSDTKANTGTYTCTYSGCGNRFTTSAKLQKHRRESHRRSPATSNSVSTAAAIASRNAQPGPHRCMRPNANGKPCNSIFSRPYDLTRHEDTIHNNRKEKVRCEICNDEKTFSRSDALVRHRRVKHGIH